MSQSIVLAQLLATMRRETTVAIDVIIFYLCWPFQYSNGSKFESFFAKHITAVGDYLMTGHGRSGGSCDLLLLGRFQHTMSGNIPRLVADSTTDLDIKPAVSSSNCIGGLTYMASKQKEGGDMKFPKIQANSALFLKILLLEGEKGRTVAEL